MNFIVIFMMFKRKTFPMDTFYNILWLVFC